MLSGQVLAGLRPILLVAFPLFVAALAAAENSEGKLHLGSISVSARGALGSRQGKQGDGRLFRVSPGMETLMQKLGFRSQNGHSDPDDLDSEEDAGAREETEAAARSKERKRLERERLERERAAEEGRRLEEEYERRESELPLRDAEQQADDDVAETRDRRLRPDRHGHSNVLRKKPRQAESELDEEERQDDANEQDELEGRRSDDDRQDDAEDEPDRKEEDDPPMARKAPGRKRLKRPLDSDADSDLELENEGNKARKEKSRKTEDVQDEVHQDEKDDKEDEEDGPGSATSEEDERPRKQAQKVSEAERPIAKAAKAKSIAAGELEVGEVVRAYNLGAKEYQDAKVVAMNKDGSITVNWDSGDTGHRKVIASDVFRPHQAGDNSPYRFEGPNAFDMLQEKENVVSGKSLAPSVKTDKAKIYDGYTLFPPSALNRRPPGKMSVEGDAMGQWWRGQPANPRYSTELLHRR